MKKISKLWLFLAIIISLLVGRALLTGQHFYTHDDIQVFRLNEYLICWQDGQIPCRWSSDLGKGYGYPLFIFYPPLIYAIPAIISKIGFTLITSLNLFAFLMFPLAAYSMYKLIHTLTKSDKLSFLAGVMYTMYPYHALNTFVRGVYAETLAWSLLPLALEGFYQLAKESKTSYYPSIILSLIVLSHNISTLIMYPLIVLWIVAVMVNHKTALTKNKNLSVTITNLLLPIGLSAFFLIPAFFEKLFVQTETMIQGYYQYFVHFISLSQVFISDYWGYGSSGYGVEYDGMSFMIGKPWWILFAVTGFMLLRKHYKNPKKSPLNPITIFTAISSLAFIFLTHARSIFIWKYIPVLQYVQFPWRFIGIAGTMMIIFTVYSLSLVVKKPKSIHVLVLSAIIIYSSFGYFKPDKFDDYQDQDFITGELFRQQQGDNVFDYLPKSVKTIPDYAKDILFTENDTPPAEARELTKQSNLAVINIDNPKDQSITFSIFNYPGWQATVDDELVHLSSHPEYGLITLDLPKGKHLVELKLSDTPLRQLSNLISIFSLLLLWRLSTSNRKKANN